MRLPRRTPLCALLMAIACAWDGHAGAAADDQSLAERIELLDWSDPARAVRLIDAAAIPAERRLLDVPMLEVSGMVYTDMHRDADVDAALADLKALGPHGDPSATVAAHYVRAYGMHRHGDYAAAVAELNAVDVDAVAAAVEQYRLLELRGSSLRRLRLTDSALPVLQQGLDVAQTLADDLRSAHALIELAAAQADAGDLDRAADRLASAQTLAAALGDESLLAAVDGSLADVAARRGQPAAARRLSLSAVEHAKHSDSEQSLARALVDLAGSYVRSREWREALKVSQQAAPLVARAGDGSVASAASLYQGLTLIALGSVKPGQEKMEHVITDALARNSLLDARDMLRAYADELQRAGYLMMALQAYQRYGEVGDRVLAGAQARSARPNAATNERVQMPRAVPPMDRAQVSAAARQVGVGRELILAIFLGVVAVSSAVILAVLKSRRSEERLRRGAERDSLTGVWTRRHFNETVLPLEGNRPAQGCVLLADFDRFKRINHTLGHLAGDAVLAAVSQRFLDALRDGDRLVRWEGEAFLILLNDVTPEEANQSAERLLLSVRGNPVPWDGTAIDCTLSIGYACFPLAGATTEVSLVGAIALVDRALQEAKRRGRDRACLISAVKASGKRVPNPGSGDSDTPLADRSIELTEMGVAA